MKLMAGFYGFNPHDAVDASEFVTHACNTSASLVQYRNHGNSAATENLNGESCFLRAIAHRGKLIRDFQDRDARIFDIPIRIPDTNAKSFEGLDLCLIALSCCNKILG